MKVLREIDNEIANVIYIELPATAGAKKLGWNMCIEKRYTYKDSGAITITRHYANVLEDVYNDDKPYYYKYKKGL